MERTGGQCMRFLVVCLASIVLTVGLVGVGFADTAAGPHAGGDAERVVGDLQAQSGATPDVDIDADDITMAATISENGTAQMEIDYRIRLESDADTEAFEDLKAEIEADSGGYLDPFRERMNRTVDAAENATNREMGAHEFRITTERNSQLQAEFGHVRFRFEWVGFAGTGDGTISAGDAVDSLFLDDSESLVFRWPERYGVESSDPRPDRTENGSAVWRGPIDFEAGQPRLELSTAAPDDGSGGTDSDPGGDPDDSTDGSDGGTDGGDGLAVMPVLGILGLVLVAGAGVAVFVLREDRGPSEDDGDEAAVATSPPDELLSNEERVLRLLQQNGGRMKQKKVAGQLDWTAAKTSQVVSDLRDDEAVDSFRLGRENVLTLPDVDIDGSAADSEDTDEGGDAGAGSSA